MTRYSLSVNGADHEWLSKLQYYIEDRWVVNISDITYEINGTHHSFNIMLNTLGDFDRVSGRMAPALRRSETAALAYALSCMGLQVQPEDCTLRFGATFEDGIREFIYKNLSDKHAAQLKEKYFDPQTMTEFVIYLGKAFVVFKTIAELKRFYNEGRAAELKAEIIELLRKLDTFGVITDLEHVVFCRSENDKREILPKPNDVINPAAVLEAMTDHVRRDAAVFVSKALGVNIIAVEYRFSAKSLCHRYTFIPAYEEDRKKADPAKFAEIEESLCAMFRQQLGGDIGRGEIISCVISPESFENLSKRHIHRCMAQDNIAEKLRDKYQAGYVKGIHLHGLTAVVVFGSGLSIKRFELSGAMESMNETMKSIIDSYDALGTINTRRQFVRCMTAADYKQEYERTGDKHGRE